MWSIVLIDLADVVDDDGLAFNFPQPPSVS